MRLKELGTVVVVCAMALMAGCRSAEDDDEGGANGIDCAAGTGGPRTVTCADNDCCTSEEVPKEGAACEGPFEGMMCNAMGECELPAHGLCGNGWYDRDESCDDTSSQQCPSCNDGNPCTADSFTGSPSTCNIVCRHVPISDCDPEMARQTADR